MTNYNYKGLMSDIKKKLYNNLVLNAEQRVSDLKAIIQEAQDAANNETKSSAGDKHETGRAMAQLETEKLNAQLSEALKLTETLTKINPDTTHQIVGLGSLVITNNGNFFIGVSLGKIEHDGEIYFAISAVSPIGQVLVTKKEKDAFSFNNRAYIINKVE
jgi:transcription elongation GreA/GreB family factor